MTETRHSTATGRLVRLGFQEPEVAAEQLVSSPLSDEAIQSVVAALASSADPDTALRSLSRIVDSATESPDVLSELDNALQQDQDILTGAAGVLGASEALGDHLARHPEDWPLLGPTDRISGQQIRTQLLEAVSAEPESTTPTATMPYDLALQELRLAYRRQLLAIARRDVVEGESYENTVADLTDLADAALETALAISRAEVGERAEACRLAVVAMGKCGGRELNYVSDVDVVFVAESVDGDDDSAIRIGTELASGLMRACSAETPEGALWEVDAGLRPEGKAGALVRTLASHVGYYERWAKTWEFQALLKARAAAGDLELGGRYEDEIAEFVWDAAGRPNFIADVQEMRRRVEDSVKGREAQRQLKLGVGGLRDVEFSVQLLQMVHGRDDALVRSGNTIEALGALADYGYVGRKDAAGLAAAYRFLRTLEHRLQLWRLRRVHVVPEDKTDLRRLAKSLGFRRDPVEEFDTEWRARRLEVRRIHEKLFYRPLLQAVARLEPGEARLSPGQAKERLTALGFADPEAALGHLMALSAGVSRRAAIQRTLLPVLLGWFAAKPDPDMALLGFRRVSDTLGSTPWYLRLLRDESVAAERLAEILGSSRYTAELLTRDPAAVALLADTDDLAARNESTLESMALTSVIRRESGESGMSALRAFRRRELLRISVADVLRLTDVEQVGERLSAVASATITGALQAAIQATANEKKLGIRFLVVGMGRLGGAEMSYSSDADVMLVYEPLLGTDAEVAAGEAQKLAAQLRQLLSMPSADPELVLDMDLRPEGRSGAIVRTLESYAAYYRQWSSPWEAQALLRARRVAGDPGLGADFATLIDPLRYPSEGLTEEDLVEMRRLKARMESERLPRGVEPARHVKLGPGGLSDVEWTVQLLQLQHAAKYPVLRDTRTLPVLRIAHELKLIGSDEERILTEAWQLASRLRNAMMLATGRPSDVLPTDNRILATVAHLMGYRPGAAQQLLEDYRRATRRSRNVVNDLFYGS